MEIEPRVRVIADEKVWNWNSNLRSCIKFQLSWLFIGQSCAPNVQICAFLLCFILCLPLRRQLHDVNALGLFCSWSGWVFSTLYLEPNEKRRGWRHFSFRCGRKTPENYSRENPRSQVGTENPIHIVPPVGFEPGSPEVEGEARHHYANLTAYHS